MRDMLEARKQGDTAFRDKDFKTAIDYYSQVWSFIYCSSMNNKMITLWNWTWNLKSKAISWVADWEKVVTNWISIWKFVFYRCVIFLWSIIDRWFFGYWKYFAKAGSIFSFGILTKQQILVNCHHTLLSARFGPHKLPLLCPLCSL